MAIFISHTSKDDTLANKIYRRLKYIHGIDCYIDDLDKGLLLRRGRKELTPFLVDRLNDCDTLLAVVTENTKDSWWVPFEIGTARQLPRIITSYTSRYINDSELPEYLLEWPRLRTDDEIDIFANKYKNQGSMLFESVDFSIVTNNVRTFENSVMNALHQNKYV